MKTRIWLLVILVVAFILRTWNVNWDDGYHFHPDERWIVMVAEKIEWVNPVSDWKLYSSTDSPMNPRFFAYGSLPVYLLKLVSGWVADFSGHLEYARYAKLNLVGRVMSAMFDTGTVLLVFLLGKKLIEITNNKLQISNKSKMQNLNFQNETTKERNNDITRYALWAAGFYAVSLFPIQNSHFYTVDVMLTFFTTLTIYLSLLAVGRAGRSGKIWIWVLLGIVWGVAVATKISGLFLGTPVGVALIISNIKYQVSKIQIKDKIFSGLDLLSIVLNALWRSVVWGLFVALVSGVTFVVLEPYAVIDRSTLIWNMQEQGAMTRDAWVFPYTRQYVGTISYIYFVEQFVRFGAGWVLGVASLAGVVVSIWYLVLSIKLKIKNKKSNIQIKNQKVNSFQFLSNVNGQLLIVDTRALLILLSFVVGYFGYVGQSEVKFMRYLLPLYPVMAIFGVVGVVGLANIKYQISNIKYKVSATHLYIVVMFCTMVWTYGFMSRVYGQENTRIQASRWLAEKFEIRNSKFEIPIGVEHWDDALPVPPWNKGFVQEDLLLYEFDSVAKWRMMVKKLAKVDAIVLASNRLSTPLVKIGSYDYRYEVTKRYYELLFSGELGFQEAADFYIQPGIGPPAGGWSVDTQKADESFQVYDHPRVRVFVKREVKSSAELFRLLWKG
jgi:hypothetical protein